jgi:hypothetical protein
MPFEQPLQPKPETEADLTKIEETAAEERKDTPELQQVSKFAQPFKDKAGIYAERANVLFEENQKQAKNLGRKGWDKAGSLYQEWSATTKLVQTAEKLADYYQSNIATENEIDQIMQAGKDKAKTVTDAMKTGYRGLEKKEELIKGAKALHDKIIELEEKIKSLKEGSAAEKETGAEVGARWEGIKAPKIEKTEELVNKGSAEAPAADAAARAKENARKEEVRKRIQAETDEATRKSEAEAAEKAKQQKQLDAEWKKRQSARASRKKILDEAERLRKVAFEKKRLDEETAAYEKKLTKGPLAWFKRLFGKEVVNKKTSLDVARDDILHGDTPEEELTPAQIKTKRAEENEWWNKEKGSLTKK